MQRRFQLLHCQVLRCLVVGYAALALWSAGGCGRKTELPDLQTQIALLQGDSLDDQYKALSNLQALEGGAAAAVPELRTLLKRTKEDNLRAEIAETLGAIGLPAGDAAADLVPLLDAKEMWPRYAAARALGVMGKAALPALPKLITLTKDRDRDVAAVAAESARRLNRLRTQK
jgi:HEAT repeat protein